jgi:hypothetical protein
LWWDNLWIYKPNLYKGHCMKDVGQSLNEGIQ